MNHRSNRTVISRTTLIHLGYDPTRSEESVEIVSVTDVQRRSLVQLNRLSALGVHRLGMTVVAQEFPEEIEFDGVIGLDFFRDTKLTINFRAGQLTLE